MLCLGPIIITIVTEGPTNNGPSKCTGGKPGVEDILDVGRDYGRRQKPAMKAGGGSGGRTATIPGFATMTQAKKTARKMFMGGAHGVVGDAEG
jgi:hypothetical protein